MSETKDKELQELLALYSGYEPDVEEAQKDKDKIDSMGQMTSYMKFPDNIKKMVRFLPPKEPVNKEGKKNKAYVLTKRHFVPAGDKKITMLCTGNDICCRVINYLRALGGEENNKLAKSIKASESYVFAAYDRAEKTVGLVNASSKFAGSIISIITQTNIFDPMKGNDFIVLKKTGKGAYPEYIVEPQLKTTPLAVKKDDNGKVVLDVEKMKEILKSIPDLNLLLNPDSNEVKVNIENALAKIVSLDKVFAWEQKKTSYDAEIEAASDFGDDEAVSDLYSDDDVSADDVIEASEFKFD